MEKALKGSAIKDIKFKTDIRGEVWINPDGYIYKAIYYLNEAIDSEDILQLTTFFSLYNAIMEMSLPKEETNKEEAKIKKPKSGAQTGTDSVN
jgi:hypothetical protein